MIDIHCVNIISLFVSRFVELLVQNAHFSIIYIGFYGKLG